MKRYSYSSELLTFVETKWLKPKFVTVGIIISIVILFGVIELNQSVGFILDSRSLSTLASENNFLRQQVSLISPRVSTMEMQTAQLHERANTLHRFLHSGRIVGDTVPSFWNAPKEYKPQYLILAMKTYGP